ncbi:MAG: ABC transporter ATP-binding protein, partial [Alphaproteobacteria bacterium]
MKDVCPYAHRPLAFVLHYVVARPIAHAVIVTAVIGAVTCSVAAQYGVKTLVDVLSAGFSGHAGAVWAGFLLLASFIAADNLLWRLASWIASSAFVAVTGDLRRDLFRHLTGHAPSFFVERMPGTL